MATKVEEPAPIDEAATYLVSVSRPFHALGISVSPMDTEVRLSGALVNQYKECLSSYTLVEE